MITVGLTGSIGMGKSTVGKMFADLGAAYWDADSAVHRLYAEGGAAVAEIDAAFPSAVCNGAVDRAALAKIVLSDSDQLKKLEALVHPLVAADRLAFLEEAMKANAAMAVLDIPLLFENGSEAFFDAVVVVSAPYDVQRERVLARPGMTEEKFNAIVAQQMPDAEKREKADFVIKTDQPLEATQAAVKAVFERLIAPDEDPLEKPENAE